MAAWRMAFRAGKNGDSLWDDCRRLGVAAIQYDEVDDLDLSLYTPNEPKEVLFPLAPSRKASLRRFVHEMHHNDGKMSGDVIYVKEGRKIVGKGIIESPYYFDKKNRIREPKGAYWQHQRKVSWLRDFPPINIQLGRSQQYVVEELFDDDVSRIEDALDSVVITAGAARDNSPDEPYEFQTADRRRVVERQIHERRGAKKFRDALRKRYSERCVVTGCKVLSVLEAAHIDPYRGEDDNNPGNGLLLRADIHTLFDLNLLGVEPDNLTLHLHPGISEEYGLVVGKRLACGGKQVPSKHALTRRYKEFNKRCKRTC